MGTLDGLALGIQVAFSTTNLIYCLLGVTLGTAIGVLPGVGPVVTISLLLPLTFGLQPETALIMLAGIYYGAAYGGSTTSILVNLPGESSSAVTCIDGYQMAKRGKAGVALATAAIGSFVAGTIGTVLVALAAPLIASVAFEFGPAEYSALLVAALISSAALARGGMAKGIGVALLGVLFGMVGLEVTTGVPRFVFDLPTLYEGIDFVAVAVGLFALSEVIFSIADRSTREVQKVGIGRLMLDRREFRAALPAILRGTALGSAIGTLPGAGQTIASFGAYVLEKAVSKRPDEFGKGAIEGVAAPEAANNAASQTAFIPMLTLGIPGSATMALMIGALMLQGITPGPQVMTTHPNLFWGLVVSMWVGNLLLLVLNLPLVGLWARMITIPYHWLYPAILCFSCIGIYSIASSTAQIGFACFFGLLGYLLTKCGGNPALFILGLVLGPMLEEQFKRAMLISKGDMAIFVASPISVGFLILAALAFVLISMPSLRRKKEAAMESSEIA